MPSGCNPASLHARLRASSDAQVAWGHAFQETLVKVMAVGGRLVIFPDFVIKKIKFKKAILGHQIQSLHNGFRTQFPLAL